MNKEHTLANCQNEVDDWIRNVGVRYFSELTNTAILMEDVGVLARLISRMFGEQSFKEGEEDDVGMEIADVFLFWSYSQPNWCGLAKRILSDYEEENNP